MQSLAEWTLEASLSPNSWVLSAPSVPHCLLLSGLICLWKSRTCLATEPFPEQKPQAVDSPTNWGNLHCAKNPSATHDLHVWACVREPRRGCAQRKGSLRGYNPFANTFWGFTMKMRNTQQRYSLLRGPNQDLISPQPICWTTESISAQFLQTENINTIIPKWIWSKPKIHFIFMFNPFANLRKFRL